MNICIGLQSRTVPLTWHINVWGGFSPTLYISQHLLFCLIHPCTVPLFGALAITNVSREVPCHNDTARPESHEITRPSWGGLFSPFLGLWALPGNRFTTVRAQLHSRDVWFEEQSTHAALDRLPFVSPHLVRILAAPPRGGINGLGPTSGLVPTTEPSMKWNERSSPPLATCRPWKPKCS